MNTPSFTVGIEEEYMLVDPETRDLISSMPESLMPELNAKLGSQVTTEFLQCQVEVGTVVCPSIKHAHENLRALRNTVIETVEQHDLRLIAASTHPFARSGTQRLTPKDRYRDLARDMQGVVRRLVISGMHVHVGIDNDDLRIDLMNQASYILPHLLALSTSSPFWKGEDSGLKSYRISIWDELPRTGLPDYFESYNEYQRHVDVLIDAGIIEDATKIWWDLRASARFPTLEMRISDICTRIEDGVCIAAIYICWMRMLYRLRRSNLRWRRYSVMLLKENRWRAHRYGIDEGLIDFGRGETVSYGELLEEILELIGEDAEALDCVDEVNHAKNIVKNGTGAHRQLEIFGNAMKGGADNDTAFRAVVDALVLESKTGL